MGSWRDRVTFFLLVFFYLLTSFRYYPGRIGFSLFESLLHILKIAPYTVGGTMIAGSLYQKFTGERLSWLRVARVFLTIGIVLECFFGLYHYLEQAQRLSG